MILGHTDLRTSVSKVKFDEEADFEVRLAVAPQKSCEKCEKPKKLRELFAENLFSTSKNEMSQIV